MSKGRPVTSLPAPELLVAILSTSQPQGDLGLRRSTIQRYLNIAHNLLADLENPHSHPSYKVQSLEDSTCYPYLPDHLMADSPIYLPRATMDSTNH